MNNAKRTHTFKTPRQVFPEKIPKNRTAGSEDMPLFFTLKRSCQNADKLVLMSAICIAVPSIILDVIFFFFFGQFDSHFVFSFVSLITRHLNLFWKSCFSSALCLLGCLSFNQWVRALDTTDIHPFSPRSCISQCDICLSNFVLVGEVLASSPQYYKMLPLFPPNVSLNFFFTFRSLNSSNI